MRHKFYHKSVVSSLLRKRYQELPNNDSTCNTINLYECSAVNKKNYE